MKQQVLDNLKQKVAKLCVLTTVGKDLKPWASMMGYAIQDDLTVILSTHKNTRKWKNILENQNVSLLFGFSFDDLYIQAEGVAKPIEGGEEYKPLSEFFFSQNPRAAKFKTDDTVFIKVTFKKIKLTDFTQHPPRTEEKDLI